MTDNNNECPKSMDDLVAQKYMPEKTEGSLEQGLHHALPGADQHRWHRRDFAWARMARRARPTTSRRPSSNPRRAVQPARRRPSARGFTLIEMMVVLVIVALMTVGGRDGAALPGQERSARLGDADGGRRFAIFSTAPRPRGRCIAWCLTSTTAGTGPRSRTTSSSWRAARRPRSRRKKEADKLAKEEEAKREAAEKEAFFGASQIPARYMPKPFMPKRAKFEAPSAKPRSNPSR